MMKRIRRILVALSNKELERLRAIEMDMGFTRYDQVISKLIKDYQFKNFIGMNKTDENNKNDKTDNQ